MLELGDISEYVLTHLVTVSSEDNGATGKHLYAVKFGKINCLLVAGRYNFCWICRSRPVGNAGTVFIGQFATVDYHVVAANGAHGRR